MAFQQFKFPQVVQDLGLTQSDLDMFGSVPEAKIPPEFEATVLYGKNLALAINTEKARSEFVIAPVLIELRRRNAERFGLFSGVELNADLNLGLNGFCDFLITRSPNQHILSMPIMAIVEAKNDNLFNGLGQCIAAMIASQILNRTSNGESCPIYGAVTTGSAWKFLKVVGADLKIDIVEYPIERLGKIMGILSAIVQSPP